MSLNKNRQQIGKNVEIAWIRVNKTAWELFKWNASDAKHFKSSLFPFVRWRQFNPSTKCTCMGKVSKQNILWVIRNPNQREMTEKQHRRQIWIRASARKTDATKRNIRQKRKWWTDGECDVDWSLMTKEYAINQFRVIDYDDATRPFEYAAKRKRFNHQIDWIISLNLPTHFYLWIFKWFLQAEPENKRSENLPRRALNWFKFFVHFFLRHRQCWVFSSWHL